MLFNQFCCVQIEDYSLVKFIPLDITDEESVGDMLLVIDTTIQFGEDAEVKDNYPEVTHPANLFIGHCDTDG